MLLVVLLFVFHQQYLGLKVKGRNKGETKLPSSCRHNQMICAINRRQYTTHKEHTEVKQPFYLRVNRIYTMITYEGFGIHL